MKASVPDRSTSDVRVHQWRSTRERLRTLPKGQNRGRGIEFERRFGQGSGELGKPTPCMHTI